MSEALSGAEFKKQLRAGKPKLGLFVNSHSPTVAEQLAHSGYDWLLVDTQHGPMSHETLSGMLAGIASGGAKSLVRVSGYQDRAGIESLPDLHQVQHLGILQRSEPWRRLFDRTCLPERRGPFFNAGRLSEELDESGVGAWATTHCGEAARH